MADYFTPENAALAQAAESALRAFEGEQRKLTELQRKMDEDTTTVRAKDRSLSVTFDGRGELIDMKFHGTKFRSMAPPELAHLIVETVRTGRAQHLEKMAETMNVSMPGLNFADIATGRVSPDQIVQSMLSPLMGQMDDILGPILGGKPAKQDESKKDESKGKGR